MNIWLEKLKQINKAEEAKAQIENSPSNDCFDPKNYLPEILFWAKENNKSNADIIKLIDVVVSAKVPKSPWGIRIKNCPVMGDYWLVSDNQAKRVAPTGDAVFTQDSILLLAELREICERNVVNNRKKPLPNNF